MARRARPLAPPRPEREKRVARPDKVVAFRLGISAESRAAAYLIAKGYRILARRWRCPLGELDIIARRRQTLIFVEVKARERLDDAAEAVTPRQRSRIAGAAEAWLASNPAVQFVDARFDAVLVAPGKMPRHIPGAFEVT